MRKGKKHEGKARRGQRRGIISLPVVSSGEIQCRGGGGRGGEGGRNERLERKNTLETLAQAD